MPSIRPFKGVIYNSVKVASQAKVISPPYDVITKSLQDVLYRRNPHNIVKLILGKVAGRDSANNNRYTRADGLLRLWLKKRILVQDNEDAVYIYSQRYKVGKKDIDRVGFIGLMKLSTGKKKNILPHENTLRAPKLDRLNLIRATKANLEPIFVAYEDKPHKILNILKKYILRNRAFIKIESDSVRHRVWRLANKPIIKKIQSIMRPKDIFIADGHHRYEVSVNYFTELQDRNVSEALKTNAGYMMAYFAELNENMPTILPTHRLVKDMGTLEKEDVPRLLAKFFSVKKIGNLNAALSRLGDLKRSCAFGLYLGNKEFYIIRLKDHRAPDALIKNSSREWKKLDVTILHLFALEYVLGIRDDEENIEFVKDAAEAVRLVDKGRYKIAFLLNPTKVSQVKRIARLGERMPRKATYFYPKPLSGLVIRKLY